MIIFSFSVMCSPLATQSVADHRLSVSQHSRRARARACARSGAQNQPGFSISHFPYVPPTGDKGPTPATWPPRLPVASIITLRDTERVGKVGRRRGTDTASVTLTALGSPREPPHSALLQTRCCSTRSPRGWPRAAMSAACPFLNLAPRTNAAICTHLTVLHLTVAPGWSKPMLRCLNRFTARFHEFQK